jgi:hypothetical protein
VCVCASAQCSRVETTIVAAVQCSETTRQTAAQCQQRDQPCNCAGRLGDSRQLFFMGCDACTRARACVRVRICTVHQSRNGDCSCSTMPARGRGAASAASLWCGSFTRSLECTCTSESNGKHGQLSAREVPHRATKLQPTQLTQNPNTFIRSRIEPSECIRDAWTRGSMEVAAREEETTRTRTSHRVSRLRTDSTRSVQSPLCSRQSPVIHCVYE